MKIKKIGILGSTWTIKFYKRYDDEYYGLTDSTSKTIMVFGEPPCDPKRKFEDWEVEKAKTLRHELLHAFLYESGLNNNGCWTHTAGHDESFIDWFSSIYPKYKDVCNKLGV